MREGIISIIGVIVGSLITIIPEAYKRKSEYKIKKMEALHASKQEQYTELIKLLSRIQAGDCDLNDVDLLRDRINLISLSCDYSVAVALQEYYKSWGKGKDQDEKCSNLIKAMRVDLGVDKEIMDDAPEIGLIDVKKIEN